MPVATINDIELNYKLEGDGEETIVLINGLADDLETWALQVDDFLAAGFRVPRFDNRGIGSSSKPAGPYSSRMLARRRREVPGRTPGITSVHLMGISMGGMIAQDYALAYPDDLRSVTFACTYAAPGPFCSRVFSMWRGLAPVLVPHPSRRGVIVDWARLRRRGERKSFWLWVVVPVIGIVVLAIPVWGDLRPGQPSPYNWLPWLTVALVAAGFVYQLVLGAVRPATLRTAAALLEGEENQATEADSVSTGG
jgi:pimeloyl-ACP methyl ester carboxylesterase